MASRNNPLGREPDVDTPNFMIWKGKEGDPATSPLITIDIDAGEEMHEARLYRSLLMPGYELLIMTKRRGDSYWFAAKGKRPDGLTFVKTELRGPVSLEDYQSEVAQLEASFGIIFDTSHPQVTPGRHYMTYFKKK
jgi:hypothetical protein